jgi:ribonuclease T2
MLSRIAAFLVALLLGSAVAQEAAPYEAVVLLQQQTEINEPTISRDLAADTIDSMNGTNMLSVEMHGADALSSAYRLVPGPEDLGPNPKAETPGPTFCWPGESCWPSPAQVKSLSDALDPQANRTLHWKGGENPIPAPFAIGTAQPLYGMGTDIKPLYERTLVVNMTGSCILPSANDFCKAAMRNDPAENWEPAFVVWPLTTAHVQLAVKFARMHQLCVSVAGTGHDFLNRHSCNNGIMIRTSLLKDMDWTLDGVVKLGAGLTFSEVTHAGSLQEPSVFISTGWASTVGIAGWSTGGGHGPLAPSTGSGVDNVVEVELVTADGSLVTANAKDNSDLLWALRGGGGSTWGVMTALTLRKHLTPKGGFSKHTTTFEGKTSMTEAELLRVVDHVFDWALGVSENWGGLMFISGSSTTWSFVLQYWYAGAKSDADFQEQVTKLTNGPIEPSSNATSSVPDWWRGMVPTPAIATSPLTCLTPFKVTGDITPSALLNRSVVGSGNFRTQVTSWLKDQTSRVATQVPIKQKDQNSGDIGLLKYYPDFTIQIYHDIHHPNVSKHYPANATSASAGWREAMMHLISPTDSKSMKTFQSLADHSYFGESAYNQGKASWKQRYWGSNYEHLLAVKKKYDPNNIFWCHNCVGSDLHRVRSNPNFEPSASALPV